MRVELGGVSPRACSRARAILGVGGVIPARMRIVITSKVRPMFVPQANRQDAVTPRVFDRFARDWYIVAGGIGLVLTTKHKGAVNMTKNTKVANENKGLSADKIWEKDIQEAGSKAVALVYNAKSGKIYGILAGSTLQEDTSVLTRFDGVDAIDGVPSDVRIWAGSPKKGSGVRFTQAWSASPKVKPVTFKLKGVKTLADVTKVLATELKLPEEILQIGLQLGTLHLSNLLGIDNSSVNNEKSATAVRKVQKTLGVTEYKKLCGAINRACDKLLGITYDDKKPATKKEEKAEAKSLLLW